MQEDTLSRFLNPKRTFGHVAALEWPGVGNGLLQALLDDNLH